MPAGACRSLNEVAELTRKPVSTVHEWTQSGLASRKEGRHRLIDDDALIRFLAARDYQPGSERERLAKEQADKIALDNARKRGELLYAHQVADALSRLGAELAARHDAISGRLAGELAGLSEPAVIRARLLDELRRVRGAFADTTAELADALGADPDDGGDPAPAAAEDAEPVGRSKPRASTGKRRARPVAK